jgi:hypothetical protein
LRGGIETGQGSDLARRQRIAHQWPDIDFFRQRRVEKDQCRLFPDRLSLQESARSPRQSRALVEKQGLHPPADFFSQFPFAFADIHFFKKPSSS